MADTIYTRPINEVFEAGMEEGSQQGWSRVSRGERGGRGKDQEWTVEEASDHVSSRRFVRKTNEMYKPVLTNVYDYEACKSVAYEVFEKKKADEIISEVQKDF